MNKTLLLSSRKLTPFPGISGSGSGQQGDLDKESLSARCLVLRKYVDDNVERQKQTLYALQHLMHRLEHPNSEFTIIIIIIYNIIMS